MGNLNDIRFTKTNGGMGRAGASVGLISGLVFGGFGADVLTFGTASGNLKGFDTISENASPVAHICKFQSPKQLDDAGIVWTENGSGSGTNGALNATEKAKNALYYHINEFFRISEEGTLYVMIKAGATQVAAADLTKLQNYADGAIRQCGVFDLNTTHITVAALQTELTTLEANHMPMSVVLTYNGAPSGNPVTLVSLANLAAEGKCNVSVLIGCDGDATLAGNLDTYAHYGCIGACIGAISKASVHESIAWVQKFPLGLKAPALFNGQLIKNVSIPDQETLNDNRYIFVRTHVGIADNYFNDSHTCDLLTSDYAYIENVRTIDKACRGVRSKLLPDLNSPLSVDSSTGKLSADTVALLETVAGEALEDMEKAGELSGFRAEINPDQNVLATSEVEVVIKNVPMGVMRKVNVKIGFATQV